MKLLNKLITKTAIYKHLKDLYEQALKEYGQMFYDYNIDKSYIEHYKKTSEKYIKQIKKIRARVNKLDKKDENVKEIKKLIKEVL